MLTNKIPQARDCQKNVSIKKICVTKNCQSKKRRGTLSQHERKPDKLFEVKLK